MCFYLSFHLAKYNFFRQFDFTNNVTNNRRMHYFIIRLLIRSIILAAWYDKGYLIHSVVGGGAFLFIHASHHCICRLGIVFWEIGAEFESEVAAQVHDIIVHIRRKIDYSHHTVLLRELISTWALVDERNIRNNENRYGVSEQEYKSTIRREHHTISILSIKHKQFPKYHTLVRNVSK